MRVTFFVFLFTFWQYSAKAGVASDTLRAIRSVEDIQILQRQLKVSIERRVDLLPFEVASPIFLGARFFVEGSLDYRFRSKSDGHVLEFKLYRSQKVELRYSMPLK